MKVFLFANSKCKRYFHNRLKPSKLTWKPCTGSSIRSEIKERIKKTKDEKKAKKAEVMAKTKKDKAKVASLKVLHGRVSSLEAIFARVLTGIRN
ncbi:60S ribosomal protein [Actinidia chinensis var. chinensis]|uniref:60S ribosomal protein n=1 Tax=Actinidia chinensis var. chinensis TaxID=1590841 RepID=A0A2R6PM65_ACTCC|nr:60S ribosomal protein [Actinidia chinensis var. chinensis]